MTVTGDAPGAAAPTTADPRRDALVERLFEAVLGAFDLFSIHLGLRLGLYATLADGRARTSRELADAAGIDERYAREWLEQQAVGGILDVVPDDGASAGVSSPDRRYRLPAPHAEVLLDPESPALMGPMSHLVVGAAARVPDVVGAFGTGAGVPWSAYGEDVLGAQEALNRPVFRHALAAEWLPSIADVDARLRQPGARVADVGAGAGWASIAIAEAYPSVGVDGIDPDPWSHRRATENATAAGVGDRVTFHQLDAADARFAAQYDLVLIFEALHDMAQPVEVLAAARGMLAPGGTVLVVDERVAETFGAPGDATERLMYGYSVLVCLPNSLAESPSVATGTVIRPDTVRRYASEAGFAGTTVLPIEHDTFRVYRLDP